MNLYKYGSRRIFEIDYYSADGKKVKEKQYVTTKSEAIKLGKQFLKENEGVKKIVSPTSTNAKLINHGFNDYYGETDSGYVAMVSNPSKGIYKVKIYDNLGRTAEERFTSKTSALRVAKDYLKEHK